MITSLEEWRIAVVHAGPLETNMTRYALLIFALLAGAPPAAAQWRYVPSANGVGTAVTNASDGQLLAVMCFGKTWSVSAGTTDPEMVSLAEQMDALDITDAGTRKHHD